jgi:hypothetical protein
LKHLDKRYRTKYGMSMIENLENIRGFGIRRFVASESARWACPECGGMICIHNRYCYRCGKSSNKMKINNKESGTCQFKGTGKEKLHENT